MILTIEVFVFFALNLLKENHFISTPSQIKTTIRHNTLTAEDAGIFFNAELDILWNRIGLSKQCDITLQLLEKGLSYSFISSNTRNYDTISPEDDL